MTQVNWEEVERLLIVAEKCSGHSGKLSNLQSAAIGELLSVNSKLKAEATPKPAPAPEPEPEPEPTGAPGDTAIYTSDTPNPSPRRL